VAWTVDGGNYELVVADDGRGFDPERAIREQAFGVVGMRERAEVIGAILRIDSHPGGGTKVIVSAGRVHHSVGAEGHGGG
jgi:signal transduction histidine kinase